MSSLNNAPETEYREADLGWKIQKLGLILIVSSIFLTKLSDDQLENLSQIQDNINAARAKITKKADKNPLAENANQPASLNRSGGDTSQAPSTDAETHLAAAEEAIRSKINFFRVAHYFFFFSGLLCSILFVLGHGIFLQYDQQKGR